MNSGHIHEISGLDELDGLRESLSPTGADRRRALLGTLNGAVRSRGRRRLAIRGGLAACGLVVVAGAVVLASRPTPEPTASPLDTPGLESPIATAGAPRHAETPPDLAPPPAPVVPRLVAYVVNDATVVDRLSALPGASRVEILDDAGLLAELRAAGLPAGLVRREEGLTLAFHRAPSSPPARPY